MTIIERDQLPDGPAHRCGVPRPGMSMPCRRLASSCSTASSRSATPGVQPTGRSIGLDAKARRVMEAGGIDSSASKMGCAWGLPAGDLKFDDPTATEEYRHVGHQRLSGHSSDRDEP